MKEWIKSLLSETGDVSMTRFLSLLCVVSAVIIAMYGLHADKNLDSLVGITSVFLGAGFGGKVAQKFAEKKDE